MFFMAAFSVDRTGPCRLSSVSEYLTKKHLLVWGEPGLERPNPDFSMDGADRCQDWREYC